MGTYDEYGYLGIQIKMNATGERYKPGDDVPLPNGLVFGLEGAVLVVDGLLADVVPYDCMWDKWIGWVGAEVKELIESNNPVKIAVDAVVPDSPSDQAQIGPEYKIHSRSSVAGPDEILRLIEKTREEVEAEMAKAKKPYWMVHRRGAQSGPATAVHHSFGSAMKEAIRLARLEMDSFDVMESVFTVKPQRPVEVDIEPFDVFGEYFEDNGVVAFGAGMEPHQTGARYPDSLDPEPECTCEGPGEGCNICGGFDERMFEPLPFPPYWKDLASNDAVDAMALSVASMFGLPAELIGVDALEKVECPCGCDDYMLGPEHEIGDEDCEICAGIEGDLAEAECDYGCTEDCASSHCIDHAGELYQPEIDPNARYVRYGGEEEADVECICGPTGWQSDRCRAHDEEPEIEECGICAIMEKLDMPALYHLPLGMARCVMTETKDDAWVLHQISLQATPDETLEAIRNLETARCALELGQEPSPDVVEAVEAIRELIFGSVTEVETEPEGCCGGTKDDCCH